jgi:hypothetical protein
VVVVEPAVLLNKGDAEPVLKILLENGREPVMVGDVKPPYESTNVPSSVK